jgi:hypothetical protein
MAKVRIGFSTAFELENELVGIGTDNPTNTKQVLGNIHATNAKAVGVSTLTTFDGFTDTKLSLQGSVGAKQHTTSGEIIIEGEVTVSSGTTYTSGPENLTVTDSFTLPGISDDKPTVGTTRFNENLAALEFYTGTEWKAVNSYVDMGNMGRAVWMCGMSPNYNDSVGFINIQTKGNEQLGGVSVHGNSINHAGCGSRTRGVWAGEQSPGGYTGDIDYITMASVGDSIDFGDLSQARATYGGSFSSSTRGVWAGGYNNTLSPSTSVNTMDYVQIGTLGNALDFGDMRQKQFNHTAASSPTKGFIFSGSLGDGNEIQMSNIASTGETMQEVGVTATDTGSMAACANSVRAVIFGGGNPVTDLIQRFGMSSLGNAVEFGNLSAVRMLGAAVADSTRAVSVSGRNPSNVNIIEYVEIVSGGSAIDFGDMTSGDGRQKFMGTSDSHGGLGGF